MQVRHEVHARLPHARELLGAQVARRKRVLAVHLRHDGRSAAVQVRERRPLIGVRHDDEVPALSVGPGWGLECDLDTALNDFWLHGARQVEASSDDAGGGE